MTFAVLQRRHSHKLTEVQRKGALIIETKIKRDLHDGFCGAGQFTAGGLEPKPHDKLLRAHLQNRLKFTIQLPY